MWWTPRALGPANTTYDTGFDLVFSPTATRRDRASSPAPRTRSPTCDPVGDDDGNPIRSDVELDSGFGFSSGHNYGPPDGTAQGTAAPACWTPRPASGRAASWPTPPRRSSPTPPSTWLFFNELEIISPSNFGQTGDSLTHPFTYNFQPDDNVIFADGEYLIEAGNAQAISQKLGSHLQPLTLTVTSDATSAAGTRGLGAMLTGFAAIGGAVRARRRPAAA